MARPKEDLSKLSLNQLEELTGATHRTIKKYLKEAGLEPLEETDNAKLYNPREALPVIFEKMGYKVKNSSSPPVPLTAEDEQKMAKVLDPFIQRARRDRANADKAEFELSILRREHVPSIEVKKGLSDMVLSFRTKVLALAPRQSPVLFAIRDIKKFEKKWDELNRETLEELSKYDVTENPISDDEESD